jgi:hypothetical protein
MAKSEGKKGLTAEELMAQLEADPEWVARRDAEERERERTVRINRADAAPVLDDLQKAGFDVEAIAELHERPTNYRDAIPILLRWLPRVENAAVKEDIVRALTVRWAKPDAAAILVEEFRRVEDGSEDLGLRWAIGNALAEVADDSVLDDLADITTDERWGRSREMVALALGNMTDPRAADVLRALLRDDDVAGHAVVALGNLRAREARAEIERFLAHPKAWVRKEAQRALRKLDT